MASIDLETTREYIRSHAMPAENDVQVCVDGRTPRNKASKIARGGGTLGMAIDITDALEEKYGSAFPQLTIQTLKYIARKHGHQVYGHTDHHAPVYKIAHKIGTAPGVEIGCKYDAVATIRSGGNTELILSSLLEPEFEIEELAGNHEEAAVVVDDAEEMSFPNNAEGIQVFRLTRQRDVKMMDLYLAEMALDYLAGPIKTAADRNIKATLAAIPAAHGLPIYRSFIHKNVYEVEEVGVVGQGDIPIYI